MRTSDALDILNAVRALIVGYRLQMKLGWVDISMKLCIDPDAAHKHYNQILYRAGNPDLIEMFNCLNYIGRTGRLPIIEPGSEEISQIRSDVVK